MNEQIKSMWNKAAERLKDVDLGCPDSRIKLIETFAEIIIKECGILADQYNFEKNAGTINPLKTTAYEFITQHFGIK